MDRNLYKYKIVFFYFLVSFVFYFYPSILLAIRNQSNSFLVISDIHLDVSSTHKMEIDPAKSSIQNDLDQDTFNVLISEISKNIQRHVISRPQFILILGDIVGHIRLGSNSVLESESVVFNTLSHYFPDTPIFYLFGNNDSLVKNYGPFQDASQPGSYKSPYNIAMLKAGWKNGFLSTGVECPCLILGAENTHDGYYAAYLSKKLRLITLNTVLFSPKSPSELGGNALAELNWFDAQLKSAQTKNESVLIAMHIPPGNNIYDHSSFWQDKYLKIFLKTVFAYHHNIMGILASHTHAEEIKILHNLLGKYKIGVYFTAALSTSHGNAPSLKMFSYSNNVNNNWQLTDYSTYSFSNTDFGLELKKLYDYREYYCQNKIPGSLTNMTNCLKNIEINKMKPVYSAGNQNFASVINSPDDIFFNF